MRTFFRLGWQSKRSGTDRVKQESASKQQEPPNQKGRLFSFQEGMTMSHSTMTDTHSPWYEVFSGSVEPDAEPVTSDSQSADEAWATEAVFDLYND